MHDYFENPPTSVVKWATLRGLVAVEYIWLGTPQFNYALLGTYRDLATANPSLSHSLPRFGPLPPRVVQLQEPGERA
jgi:hypothetical protein